MLWHRWFGVLGGLWLLVLALTGSLLVFYEELDHALNPELFAAAPLAAGQPPAIAAATRQALARWPGAMVAYVQLPAANGSSLVLSLKDRADAPGAIGPDGREVFADPRTGMLLGSRVYGAAVLDRAHIMGFVYRLHTELHGGATLAWLLGVLALLWLIDHGVALPLALRTVRRWPAMFRLRAGARGFRRQFDLHRAAALWLLPVTAMSAFSGAYFNLNDEFRAAISLFSRLTAPAAAARPALPRPLYAPPISAQLALARVAALPGAPRASGLGFDAAKGLWTITVQDRRDLADYGMRRLVMDARDGRIVGDFHPVSGSAADVVMAWQFPLHSGKALGWPGRLIILLAGGATATLSITGYALWWRKRTARRATHRQRPAPLQPIPGQGGLLAE